LFNDSSGVAVPTGRGSRLWSLGSLAARIDRDVQPAATLLAHCKRVALRPMVETYHYDQPLE
jgi:hypothetical protein